MATFDVSELTALSAARRGQFAGIAVRFIAGRTSGRQGEAALPVWQAVQNAIASAATNQTIDLSACKLRDLVELAVGLDSLRQAVQSGQGLTPPDGFQGLCISSFLAGVVTEYEAALSDGTRGGMRSASGSVTTPHIWEATGNPTLKP